MILPALARLQAAPLDPSPDRAHDLLRRELLRPEYHRQNLMQRFLAWLADRIDALLHAASQVSPLGTVGSLVVFLALVLGIGALLSRVRRSARRPAESGPVLAEARVSAADLRRRAEAALAAGQPALALVEGFRALTARQIERGRLPDLPGATAHEVATTLGNTYAGQRTRVDGAAVLFDAVLYGDRPATAEQAGDVLRLDDELAVNR